MQINLTEEIIAPYVEKGLVNKQTVDDFSIYCYSKETFFSHDWDDVTKMCRGLVFYKGKPINHPFPKIFNLDETDDTSFDKVLNYLQEHDYVLCHKVNGHLTIATYVPEIDDFIVHTKGSLQDNEMNQYDRKLFYKKCTNLIAKVKYLSKSSKAICGRMTFMFESVNPTDKHTLYELEAQRYGEDELVMLGGYFSVEDNNWSNLPDYSLRFWAELDDIPVAQMSDDIDIDEITIKEMFKETDTEGYVIWFPTLDFRVKIKTTDYWKMRFIKDLSPENIIEKFVAGGNNRLWTRYPEEVADKIVELVMKEFSHYVKERVESLPLDIITMSRKEVGLSEHFTKVEKFLIFTYKDGNINNVERMAMNSELRKEFKDVFLACDQYVKWFSDELIQYIEGN